MTDDQQIEIDEDSCLALTGDAEQCGNGIDTDASDPEAGLCGIHNGTDCATVTDFAGPAWAGLRNDLVDLVRSENDAYALSTLTPDIEELWHRLTALEDIQIGDYELSTRRACYLAREVGQHPDLDVADHPFGYTNCIALQGRSAKNEVCPNSAYGASLLCGMHQEADLPGTILDEGEDGPDLEPVTVDSDNYQLVEQRGEDLIVVDPDEWELQRLTGAAGDETRWDDSSTTPELADDAAAGNATPVRNVTGDRRHKATADGGTEPTAPPQAPSNLPKYMIDGVEKQSPEDLRDLAAYAERMAEWQEAEAQRELEEQADQLPTEIPEEWDDDEWEDAVDDAHEEADIPASKGTLTTKTIDGRDYYYLQWREGSKIRSQYVAPVTPASAD